jgi:hypothetical protein
METSVAFLDCPAYLDQRGAVRCGLPAEVEYRYAARSCDGQVESAKIRCPRGHWFNGPIELLIIVAPAPGRRAAPGNEAEDRRFPARDGLRRP